MKAKKLLSVICTALALMLCVAFAACKDEKDPDPAPSATEYTVTFDANGGTLTGSATVKVKKGEKITGAPTAAKTDYVFEAWYTAASAGDKIDLTTYTVSKDVTLYAHYTEPTPPPAEKVKVTFDANGGVIDGETVYEVDKNGNLLNLPTATREGYKFDAWYDAATGGKEVDLMFNPITADITVYAHWIKTYTVTFNPGEGTILGQSSITVEENAKLSNVPEASKPGDEFHGWYTAADGGEKIDFAEYTVTGDVTLYAHYGVITMPVKTLKSHEGNVIGYRIEAEESKIVGTQSSDNQANPGTFFENVETASGGKSIGYLGVAGNKITFTFRSETAGKATISLRATSNNTKMGSGWNDMWVDDQVVTEKDFTVAFNGNAVKFAPATLRGAGKDKPMTWNLYWDPVSFGELDVKAGVNEIVITVAAQTVPNMDCLDIETSLNITCANGDEVSGEATLPAPPAPAVAYEKAVTGKLIVTDHAEGPAIYKAVLGFTEDIPLTAIATNPFKVGSVGNAKTDKVYLSNANGEKLTAEATSSRYVTIEYAYSIAASMWGTGPANNVKPFTYNQQSGKNSWNNISNYALTISGLTIGETTYTKFTGEFTAEYDIPELDKWGTTGSYTDSEANITLKYASYAPEANAAKTDKKPLIVWLHGAGEGGTNPSIVLLGNQVVNLAKPLIQNYFITDTCAGAYVLAPQSPTMWMDNGNGQQGGSNVGESIYTESLFKLIKNFVDNHTDIDDTRIYIGGCSNGGWMTVEMLSKHGEYFAAAYPIAVPFDKTAGLTKEEFARLVNVPMWITHAKADMTVSIGTNRNSAWQPEFKGYTETNSNSLYIELLKAGATNVHYTLFDNVVIAEGEDKTPQGAAYDGHYSWIYTLRDECSKVQATTGSGENGAFILADITENSNETVTVNGEAVTLWGWLAAQAKTPAQA